MAKKFYLTSMEKRAGKSFIALGIVSILKEQSTSFCCFKLFNEQDNAPLLLLEKLAKNTLSPLMDISTAIAMLRDEPDDLFAKVLEKSAIANNTDLTFYEGSDFESDNDAFEYEFNLTLAYQLNCELILVISAKDRTLSHTLSVINTALDMSKKKHAHVAMVIINRMAPAQEQQARELFTQRLSVAFIIVPEFDDFANPSVGDIANKLNAHVICGKEELHRSVKQITVAAKTVGNFLESRLDRKGMLIITPDDRLDILLGSLLADQSAYYPKIAGIVLTGGEMPGQTILEIIAGLEHPFPVLITPSKTYETATTLFSAKYNLTIENMDKVDTAIRTMTPYLFSSIVKLLTEKPQNNYLSPALFLYNLLNNAEKCQRHIVLPEGHDQRILIAADYLLKRKIVKISLIGLSEKITFLAKRLQLDLSEATIIEIDKSSKKEKYAERYYELRKHKNVNLAIAMERMNDVNYFAAMMVYCGDADGMVSGAEHTTADTVRPALEIIKTKPSVSKVSSIFIMCMPTRVLIYGDCAINPEPDSETLAEITHQAVNIAKQLGISPKVALLSYSSGDSGKGHSVDKVAKAMALVRKEDPHLVAEGPIQYDAAVDPLIAAKKIPNSEVAGCANVLIFPDLNTGNNTYKAVQRESGALAIGPVLLGLNKPVNDLSRGCTAQDIINTILVTAIQAGEK